MRVFLDSRDLIDVLQGNGPCTLEDLRRQLGSNGHQLVVSPIVIFELSAPLLHESAMANVMRLLRDLETLPLTYIATGQLTRMELEEAIAAKQRGTEYSPIDPYVARFDAAIPTSGPAPTELFLNYSIPETVFNLWHHAPEVFRWEPAWVHHLQQLLRQDREMKNPPRLSEHFRVKVRRQLGGSYPSADAESLADWIYERPQRCPGVRLEFDVFDQLRRNLKDLPEAADFGDFSHVQCLPYVDLITLDARMATYVRQATRQWDDSSAGKVSTRVADLLQRL